MSQTYGTPSSSGAGGDSDQPTDWTSSSAQDTAQDSTRDVAAEEARGVAGDVKSAGQQTAATAKDQAAQVAGEAKVQARQVFDQAKVELDQQVQSQHQRAAGGLSSLADELSDLVQGTGSQEGMVHDLAQQASDRVREAAQWLEQRQPGEVLDEVRSFARRRPGAFLAAAAVIGLVGGRMTRGLADQARDDSGSNFDGGRRMASTPATDSYTSVPGQRAYTDAPVGMSTMPPTPATSSFSDPTNDDALLTGTSVEDPLTDTTRTWGGEPSGPYGEEKH